MTNVHNLLLSISYVILNIYISDRSRLVTVTVADGIEPHWSYQVHNINPQIYVLGHEDHIGVPM